jgi:hypothetical protein
MERIDRGAGFGLLDGVALVIGAAIASIHLLKISRGDLPGQAWFMVAVTFTWVAVTAAGPFVYLARRFSRPPRDYPKLGDRLWAILGLPWLVTALMQTAAPETEPKHNPLFATTLSLGLAIVCLIAWLVIWNTWVMASPQDAAKVEAAPWTNRVGLILSIAWPIQCGLGMIVLS